MKKLAFLLIIFVFSNTCKAQNIPEALTKIFNHHGGLETWKSYNTLEFKRGNALHTIDLKSRKESISTEKGVIGFDGKNYWKTTEKGNPKFLINLHFYFLAMPFVLADPGITYNTDVPFIEYEGIKYPGIKISFNTGVGVSDNDNYIIYYHPTTYEMTWLAYTVTYNRKKASNKYSLKKYDNWQVVNKLLVPTSIQSYKHNNFKNLVKKGKPMLVKNIHFSTQKPNSNLFIKP